MFLVVVVNLSSNRQNRNKGKLLTKQNTTLLIAVRGHQRSPWAHPAGGLGAVSIRKTVLQGMAIPMLKIRRPNGRLIFNMDIAIRR